jgi:septal ring factor EnvC (AmiA/AmiB activator)
MAGKTMRLLAVAALLLIAGSALSGCGPKPPCEGADVTAVRGAQDECAAATDELSEARDTRAGLEADVASARSEITSLQGQKPDLEDRLHDLKKGSGR